jgi:hypothetical protein
MKLHNIALGLALAVAGSAFAATTHETTVTRVTPHGTVTKHIVRTNDRHHPAKRVVIVNRHHPRHVQKVVVMHPQHRRHVQKVVVMHPRHRRDVQKVVVVQPKHRHDYDRHASVTRRVIRREG